MKQYVFPAPAKINHFLHIVGQRPDGYHYLQTLFQFLAYSDTLRFQYCPHNEISVSMSTLAQPIALESNLIYQAAKLLWPWRQQATGIAIKVDKRLPIGAGLGGGSSNAATTLVALNLLWQCHRTLAQLLADALKLGADVPVFVLGHAAWGEGIGEQLTPAHPAEQVVLVITPPCTVSTQQVFSQRGLTSATASVKIDGLNCEAVLNNTSKQFVNDLAPWVSDTYPVVKEALNWLNQYACAKLSGSGSSLFATFKDKSQAQAVLQKLPSHLNGFITNSCNVSPLKAAVALYS
jgi:4-diphosphocytidyl-2-C-methyl-D-erythritol kinase